MASLAYSLIEEAFEMSQSIPSVIIGFISGGFTYTIANYYLDRRTSQGNIRHRKKSSGTDAGGGNGSGLAILVGSVMDNIPENMALGISLAIGGSSRSCSHGSYFHFQFSRRTVVFRRYEVQWEK